jgi:hypothetical protein
VVDRSTGESLKDISVTVRRNGSRLWSGYTDESGAVETSLAGGECEVAVGIRILWVPWTVTKTSVQLRDAPKDLKVQLRNILSIPVRYVPPLFHLAIGVIAIIAIYTVIWRIRSRREPRAMTN